MRRQFMNALNRSASRVLLGLGCMALDSPTLRAQTCVKAWFAPGREITNAVAVRYHCRVVENQSPNIMILCGGNRLYGPAVETYLLENNLYANGLNFADGVCTTWPQIGQNVPTQSSLRSAIPDYNEHGWIGAQPLSPAMFPRQTYEIDGTDNLWKIDMISQTNLNGVVCEVELARGGVITNLAGWTCAGALDAKVTFREWDTRITFGGATYTNRFAVPDANGQYITGDEMLDFYSEFSWLPDLFQIHLWNLEAQREGQSWWQRINQFNVYRQDACPTNYGTRVVNDNGTNVIEISNTARPSGYLALNSQFDLSVSLDGSAPDLAPISVAVPGAIFPGETIPVVTVVTNATAFPAEAFGLGYFFSPNLQVTLNDLQLGGGVAAAAGLAGLATVALTNEVTIPAALAPGTYWLQAAVDYQGLVLETVKSNNTLTVPLTVLGCLPSAGFAVTNSWVMPAQFELPGWLFEELPDTRPGGVAGGTAGLPVPLGFARDLSLLNGFLTNQGPAYTADTFCPYIMLDTNNQWLILHPGVVAAASLGLVACRGGGYRFTGAFARANDAQFAGDGVFVAMVHNLDTTNLLFSAAIPSSAAVDPSALFQGTGVAPFDVTLTLAKGEFIRFAVFNGPPGSSDVGFDATALRFTVTLAPPPPLHLNVSRTDNGVQVDWPSLPGETYQVLSTTDFSPWTLAAQLMNAATNHLCARFPAVNRLQAFRVQLMQ